MPTQKFRDPGSGLFVPLLGSGITQTDADARYLVATDQTHRTMASISGITSATGFLFIEIPTTWSPAMAKIAIHGYDYTSTTGEWELNLGGYCYNPALPAASSWVNTSARLEGGGAKAEDFGTVAFLSASSDRTYAIRIGAADTVWNYPQIQVEAYMTGRGDPGTQLGIPWITSFATTTPAKYDSTVLKSASDLWVPTYRGTLPSTALANATTVIPTIWTDASIRGMTRTTSTWTVAQAGVYAATLTVDLSAAPASTVRAFLDLRFGSIYNRSSFGAGEDQGTATCVYGLSAGGTISTDIYQASGAAMTCTGAMHIVKVAEL